MAKFLGMSGLIFFSSLIFSTRICIGSRHNKLEKCMSFGTFRKMNFFYTTSAVYSTICFYFYGLTFLSFYCSSFFFS